MDNPIKLMGNLTTTNKNAKSEKPMDDFGLVTLKVIMGVGLLIMVTASVLIKEKGFLPVLSLSCIIGLASLLIGGFLGFLFGIPRSTSNVIDTKKTPFGHNTNLEQVSDWLTKIIVGVSLTQLPAIMVRLHNLTNAVAHGFDGSMIYKYSYPYGGAIMIFYSVSGFLFVYLWCVLYLKQQLDGRVTMEEVRDELDRAVSQVTDEVKTQTNNSLELDKVLSQIRRFNEQRSKIVIEESSEEFKGIIEKTKPSAVTVLDDCQKNRWGGQSSNDWCEVKASFANNDLDEDNSCLITLEVGPKPGATPQNFNTVYFFLHDSYSPGCIKQVLTPTGEAATLSITSYEAFTVGVYILETDTKLELDLNNYEGSPEEYKYKDALPTIKELEEKKALLEKGSS